MEVLPSEQRYLVSTVAIIYTKEGQTLGRIGRFRIAGTVVFCVEVKNGCVGILHADTPALHGRDTIDTALISTLGRGLNRKTKRVSYWGFLSRHVRIETPWSKNGVIIVRVR